MLWDAADYLDLMTFRGSGRRFFTEIFGLLVGLEEEWRAQGASEREIDLTAFDFDRVKRHYVGGNGFLDNPPETVIREDEYERISRDALGRTVRLVKASATIPLPLDYPVKDMDDWLRFKPRLLDRSDRSSEADVEEAIRKSREGYMICASIVGGYDVLRELMGDEGACTAYYDEPELVADVMGTVSDCAFSVYDRISRKVRIDLLGVHEDLAGKSGPMVGPRQVDEFIAPYYKRIWDLLSSRGARLFEQDSDGNILAVMEPFMRAGVNLFYPMEPAAGMDIVALRWKYGKRAAFLGGIDKHVLREGREAILRELTYKLQPEMQAGGVAFGLDHRIPNGTPIEAYRYYVETARELLGMDPLPQRKGGGTE